LRGPRTTNVAPGSRGCAVRASHRGRAGFAKHADPPAGAIGGVAAQRVPAGPVRTAAAARRANPGATRAGRRRRGGPIAPTARRRPRPDVGDRERHRNAQVGAGDGGAAGSGPGVNTAGWRPIRSGCPGSGRGPGRPRSRGSRAAGAEPASSSRGTSPGEVCARAPVGADPEAQVAARIAVQAHPIGIGKTAGSWLAATHGMSTRSPVCIGQPPTSASVVAVRAIDCEGANARRNSSVAVSSRSGDSISRCRCSGWALRWYQRPPGERRRRVDAAGDQQPDDRDELVLAERQSRRRDVRATRSLTASAPGSACGRDQFRMR